MGKNKITFFIYSTVFLSEFSFFFVLHLLGNSSLITAANVAFYLAGSVILESILMVTITGLLERFSRKLLMATAFILRSSAFVCIILSLTPSAWLIFFTLMAFSKAISKPFLREILSEHLNKNALKRALTLYSFFQNAAVVIAPLVATSAIKYNASTFLMFFLHSLVCIFVFYPFKLFIITHIKHYLLKRIKKQKKLFFLL
ncbi:MFS transporter [Bartonella sp. MM55XZML]|uniref:MFS transporter n=1 Tax=Bartonella sp. MM55XZML TaxID=3243552 RepID=UPI0035D0EC1E